MLDTLENDPIEHQPMKIGTLLVNEGFIRKADLAEAIEIQQRDAQLAGLAMGKLLVKKRLIKRHQLQLLLEHPELREDIGAFSVERGRIDQHRLGEYLFNRPRHQPLAEALAEDGILTDEDLEIFLKRQLDSPKLCRLAVRLGMVSQGDMDQAIREKQYPRTIGEILCDLNLITPLDLNSVLTKYRKRLKLGEILLKRNLIDAPRLEKALDEHAAQGEPLGRVLLRQGILTETQLYNAFAAQYNIPFREPGRFQYSAEQREVLTKIVDKTVAHQSRLIPLQFENRTLTLAIADPENLEAVHNFREKRVDLRVHCALVTESVREKLFAALYFGGPTSDAPPEARPDNVPAEKPPPLGPPAPSERKPEMRPPISDEARPPAPVPAGELVDRILEQAVTGGAEAIHIDPAPGGAALKFRIAGRLRPPADPQLEATFRTMTGPVVAALKARSGLHQTHRRLPQEGAFRVSLPGKSAGTEPHAFSLVSCPTLSGEAITLRRIRPCPPAPDMMMDLPLSGPLLSALKSAAKDGAGMILVAAPPGAGRAATLYGLLRHLHQPDAKAVTVDDPTAYSLPAAAQLQVNPAEGFTYPVLLRAAVRLDPDVILTGDLSDPDSVAIALQAARRGVLLLGAIIGADAANAICGFSAPGAPRGYAIDAIKAVLAQRYVRKICPECRRTYRPGPEEWQPLFEHYPGHLTFHRGAGCPACGFSGYRGQLSLFELMIVNDAIARGMKRGESENDIRHLSLRTGGKTLVDDGLSKLDRTTLSEILAAVPAQAVAAFKCTRAEAPDGSPETDGPRTDDVEYKIVLRPGAISGADIRRLHGVYEVLMEQAAPHRPRSALSAFETFIETQLATVCRQYGCSAVAFLVQRRNGKAVLFASPEP